MGKSRVKAGWNAFEGKRANVVVGNSNGRNGAV